MKKQLVDIKIQPVFLFQLCGFFFFFPSLRSLSISVPTRYRLPLRGTVWELAACTTRSECDLTQCAPRCRCLPF